MSIIYRIDKIFGITYTLWDGRVGDAEFVAHTNRMVADPDWPPFGKMQLTDVTSMTSPDLISMQVIEDMAAVWGAQGKRVAGLRLGIVANQGFDKSKIFESLVARNSVNVIVFNNVHTACIWLGIDAEKAEQVLAEMRAEARAGQQP